MRRLVTGADRDALVARLRTLRPEAPARWGRMTCPQMVCHVADAMRWALGERPTDEDRSNPVSRTLVKWLALGTALPWPQGAPTGRRFDQLKGGGTPPGGFDADVEELTGLIDRWMTIPARGERPDHPFFGRMRLREWQRWAWAHADHHLRQFGA